MLCTTPRQPALYIAIVVSSASAAHLWWCGEGGCGRGCASFVHPTTHARFRQTFKCASLESDGGRCWPPVALACSCLDAAGLVHQQSLTLWLGVLLLACCIAGCKCHQPSSAALVRGEVEWSSSCGKLRRGQRPAANKRHTRHPGRRAPAARRSSCGHGAHNNPGESCVAAAALRSLCVTGRARARARVCVLACRKL